MYIYMISFPHVTNSSKIPIIMTYILSFCMKSLKSTVYSTLTSHFSRDWPHFKCSTATGGWCLS